MPNCKAVFPIGEIYLVPAASVEFQVRNKRPEHVFPGERGEGGASPKNRIFS